jgi:phospholipid/cholesterol/gamma-HCH transport system substrate-binding protein
MKWLERTANAKVHETTKKIPAEVFSIEKQYLIPVSELKFNYTVNENIPYPVRKDNIILYKSNRYRVPKGTYESGKKVYMLVEDEIADQDKDTLSSVQKIVGKADAIRTELSIFSGVNSSSGGDTEAALRIYPSPERFYHLGIASSEIGPDYEKTIVTTTNGVSVTENRVENVKNTLRFNAQVGRRINDFDFRGGLIESTGGLGVDYRLQKIGSKFSFDAFDYKKKVGPNLRMAVETQIWNVLYGRASFNDAVRSTRSATIAGGLRFNDEDLKGLLGFFW